MNVARIGRGLGANIYDKLVVAGVQLALVPVMAIGWGLDVYGAWVLLATIPSFLGVSDFGFATAAGTRMTMLVERGERDAAVCAFQSAWVMVAICSAAMAVVAIGAVIAVPARWLPTAAGLNAAEARTTLLLLLAYGIVSLQGSIVATGFRCTGLYALGVMWFANTLLIENGAAVLVVLAGGRPTQAAAALLVARIAALAVQQRLLHRRVPWLRMGWRQASRDEVRVLAGPALAVAALPVAQASFLQGTALALGAAAGAAAVPAFTATRTLSRIGLQMTQLLTHALMPEFTAAVARHDRSAQARMLVATLAAAAVVALPFAALLVIAGRPMVALWTHGVIHPPQLLMIAMAATVVLGGWWNPLSNLILAMNRHAGYSYPFVVLAVLTMPASYILSQSIGAAGAGWSIALLDAAMCVVIWRMGRRCFVSRGEAIEAARAMMTQGGALFRRSSSS